MGRVVVVSFGALLLAFAALDLLLARGMLTTHLPPTWRNSATLTGLLVLGLVPLGLVWHWGNCPLELRLLAAFVATILAWNASTRDLCPVENTPKWAARIILPLAALGSFYSPALSVLSLALLSLVFRFWLHHASFPLRVLMVMSAYGCVSGFMDLFAPAALARLGQELTLDPSAVVFFLFVVQSSHYFIAALAKARLGPKWHSWITDNHLHLLATSAYSWGWGRFVPFSSWLRLVGAIKRVEVPLQAATFALELLAPLGLLHHGGAAAFSLAFSGFHLGVFTLSGLLFWDWILVDLALAGVYLQGAAWFGPAALLAGVALLLIFPLRHKLWRPMPLGWFDSPLTARVHWEAIGVSGRVYEIYNDFMCPYERLYGRVHGCFVPNKPLLTYHLGEVFRPELMRRLIDAGPNVAELEKLRDQFGIVPRNDALIARHVEFLGSFFSCLNRGAKKQILPRGLSWAKAPGDQIFYFGNLPAYRRQEPVVTVRLRFVEEYFDGQRPHRLDDQIVLEIPIPDVPPAQARPEPTPQALDAYLLRLANGRLIDLPVGSNFLDEGAAGLSPHLS